MLPLLFLLSSLQPATPDTARLPALGIRLPQSTHVAKLPKIMLQLDNRGSFILGQGVSIYGLRLGVELVHRWRVGGGYYDMIAPLTVHPPSKSPLEVDIRFRYVSVFGEYVWLTTRHWELATPVQLGYTFTDAVRKNDNYVLSSAERHNWLGEVDVKAHYKFLDWAAVGAGAGYRTMLDPSPLVQHAFNAPIYIVQLKVFPVVLWKHWQHKEALFGQDAMP